MSRFFLSPHLIKIFCHKHFVQHKANILVSRRNRLKNLIDHAFFRRDTVVIVHSHATKFLDG